jgi:hypothetical protein
MFSDAVDEIANAELSKTTKANALALLTLAHEDTGHAMLTWEALADLFGANPGTSRRHLGELHKAGIIHYSTNGDGIVYVNFKAWIRGMHSDVTKSAKNVQKNREKDAEILHNNRADDSGDPEGMHNLRGNNAKNVQKNREKDAEKARILTRASAPDLEGRKEYTPNDPSDLPSFPPPATRQEAQRSVRLLLAVKMAPKHANELAGLVAFTVIRDHVAAWWMNRKSVGGPLYDGPGIVYRWLTDPHGAAPNAYVEADWRRQELYKQHRTPDEVAAGETGASEDEAKRRRKYIPDGFTDIAIG